MRVPLAVVAFGLSGCATFGRERPPETHPRALLVAPTVTPGQLDAGAVLGDLPARALRLGAGAPAIVASAQALDNEWIGGFVTLPREACLLAYARGGASIDDVDVAVYSDDGTSLAVDEGRDVHPTVLLCPPHPDRVYVSAHVVEGEGLVTVGAQLVAREKAVIVARALGARGARPADAWPGLDDIVRTHRLALGGKWDEFKKVALPVDVRTPTIAAMPIGADQCVDATVVPDEDVALLEVEAVDDGGRVIARAKEGAGPRALTVCSPIAMSTTLSVRPHIGRGLAAIVLARAGAEVVQDLTARPEIDWLAPTQSMEAARAGRNALLAKMGYAPPVLAAAGALVLGRRGKVPVDLFAFGGGCGRLDVVAGAPLALVDARLWADGGGLLASGEASSSITLFACGRTQARLELDARGRPGPFAVLGRPELWQDPIFAARPLAASRMLERAAVGPEMLLTGGEAKAREVALEAEHVVLWNETIAPARCVRVAVGAQGDGVGVELRAFDGAEGEIDRSEAAHAALVRACAPVNAARTVRFELRASVGRLDAIVGERMTALAP